MPTFVTAHTFCASRKAWFTATRGLGLALTILVPRAHDPSGLWQGSRALAGPDFLSMRRVFVSHSQPIRFARFDGKSVNCGLPVLDQTRALDPCHRPEGSWALGTRMGIDVIDYAIKYTTKMKAKFSFCDQIKFNGPVVKPGIPLVAYR